MSSQLSVKELLDKIEELEYDLDFKQFKADKAEAQRMALDDFTTEQLLAEITDRVL